MAPLLSPKHLTLNDVLNGRLFRVPDYQRAYAWGTKQRAELFQDVQTVAVSGQDHFLATVVCLLGKTTTIGADQFQSVEVVDGQQRITSLVILLKAIEKALDLEVPAEAKVKREITELLVKGDDHSLILLQTNHDISNVCSGYLRTGGVDRESARTEADHNLVDAIEESEEFVAEWQSNRDLVALVALLRNRLTLILHELADERVVYRVFEVLNSRGLDVRWVDKLKSQLMALAFDLSEGQARVEALKELKAHWQQIYLTLGLRSELGDEALRFLGTWTLSTRPNKLLSQQIAVETLVGTASSSLAQTVGVAERLLQVVIALKQIHEDNRLRAVTRILHARFVACAIELSDVSKPSKKALLAEWEKVTFRIFGLARQDARTKVGDYVRLAFDVHKAHLSPKQVSTRLGEIGEGFEVDSILEKYDWDDHYESWGEELRYVLYRYDEFLAREDGEAINSLQWAKIWQHDPSKSIEHIQPQSSGKRYVDNIGNLTMLPPSVNSSLQDKAPKVKAKTYIGSGLRATARVGTTIQEHNGTWNEASVRERATEIEEFIRKEWS